MNICPKCGLPREACVCEEIAKSEQRLRIEIDKRRFGKLITVISGIEDATINIKDVAKRLKSELACGGTVKNNKIELQGDHRKKAREILLEIGFQADIVS